jgi:hypothetical protein
MKNNFTKTDLFSCPIYKIRIEPNSYDKEKIINDIKYNKSLKNTRNDPRQNIGGGASDIHHSYRDFDNVNFRPINYVKLTSVYSEIFKEFFSKEIHTAKAKVNFEFKTVNYLAMTEGQWLPAHNHVSADFATVHYLNFKNDHVPTTIHNPTIFAPFVKYIQPELNNMLDMTSSDNSYFWELVDFSTEEDDMIIFPAALKHEISPQGSTKEPRITISSNINVVADTQ